MAVGDVFQLIHVQEVNNTRITNVHYYQQNDDAGSQDPKEHLGKAFDATMAEVMQTNLAPGWDSICYEIKDIQKTGQQFYRWLSSKGPGQKAGDTMNAATAAIVAQFTATGGRGGTGRMFVAGFPEDFEQRNNLTLEGITAIDLIGDQSIANIADLGVSFSPGLWDVKAKSFDFVVLSDVRVPLTKLRPRRQSTKC